MCGVEGISHIFLPLWRGDVVIMGNFPVTESRVTGWGNLAELLRVSYVDPQVENI